ncbi:hypothetical protein [Sulfobacillus harzensis]|uniref:Uncharacterized protein n=1 Tax=Sulfobacillus harzensis TaxID=2729629 RepID=A0A7Y0L7Q0_9FIRM|nr:hypothetical protein [Sulfobacillus harzensis]NMP24281.1 hypothetical protein [Sulfobacillus harzensis]
MSEWTSGPFNPGPWADWLQEMFSQVTGNLRGMVGFPREEMVKHMDNFALRSLKRHLEARQADLNDMLSVIERELERRDKTPPESPEPPASPV